MVAPQASRAIASGISVLIGLGTLTPALAQGAYPFPRSTPVSPGVSSPGTLVQVPQTVTIPAGTTLPIRYDEAERILVTPEEIAPLTLTVAANLRDRNGQILIPFGSEIFGQIEPASSGGSQFVAREIVIDGRSQPLVGSSIVVTRTEEIRDGASTGDILQGAAIGAAAAAVLAEVTGGIDVLEVLGGGALGALGGFLLNRSDSSELVVIEPNIDLDVILDAPLTLTR